MPHKLLTLNPFFALRLSNKWKRMCDHYEQFTNITLQQDWKEKNKNIYDHWWKCTIMHMFLYRLNSIFAAESMIFSQKCSEYTMIWLEILRQWIQDRKISFHTKPNPLYDRNGDYLMHLYINAPQAYNAKSLFCSQIVK